MAAKRVKRAWPPSALLISTLLTATGCGPSLDSLNKLAAGGSIHEDAPVVAHVNIEIAASPAKVWALLVNAPGWPTWQKQIESVAAPGLLGTGTGFAWKAGGATIHSQVQLCRPERQLSWTGTAMTAKAIHVWELTPLGSNKTLVTVKESMDGPGMGAIYPSQKLVASDKEWLEALKQAAER